MKKTQTIFDISQNNKVYTTKRQKNNTPFHTYYDLCKWNQTKNKKKALIFILPSSFLLYSCLFIEAWCIKLCLKGHHITPPVCHRLDQSLIKKRCLSQSWHGFEPWNLVISDLRALSSIQVLAVACVGSLLSPWHAKRKPNCKSLIKIKNRKRIPLRIITTYILLSRKYSEEKFLVSAQLSRTREEIPCSQKFQIL